MFIRIFRKLPPRRSSGPNGESFSAFTRDLPPQLFRCSRDFSVAARKSFGAEGETLFIFITVRSRKIVPISPGELYSILNALTSSRPQPGPDGWHSPERSAEAIR